MKVRVETMALGRMWRNMMRGIAHAQRPGGADEVEIARAQELGAHDVDQASSSRTAASGSSSVQKLGTTKLDMMISR